jgi:DNA-binding beta-propeller fold protein YncE
VEVGGALVDAVVLGDRLYVGDIERSLVHVLDAATGAAVAPAVAVPAGVVRLAAAGERLWVTGLEDQVTPIDVATGVAGSPATVGLGPIGAVATGQVLWVANSDDDSLSRLDPETGAPLGDAVAVGAAPVALAVDGDVLWVLEQDGPSATPLDARTGEAVGDPIALPGGFRPRGLAVAPTGVWVVGVDPSLALRLPRP